METERLILRKFREDDLDDLFAYAKLETVGPNAGWLPHPDKLHSQRILDNFISNDEVWALYHKVDEKVIGSIGLHHTDILNYENVYELGYVLSTEYAGRGLMTEGVKAVLNHAFNNLNLDKIFCGHFLENSKSEKLINRLPFKYITDTDYQSRDYGLKRSKIYVMKKEDYELYRGGKK